MKPHTCPVCYGSGNVPQGFYGPYQSHGDYRTWTSGGLSLEICKSCTGSGIVWRRHKRI